MERHRRKYVVSEYDGIGIKQFDCTHRYNYNGGFVFEYKNERGEQDLVIVPRHYTYGEMDGSLIIGKRSGNSSAARLIDGHYFIGSSVDPDAPGDDLAMLARTHVMAKAYRTVYEKQMPWRWLIIGIAIVVVIFIVVWFVKSQQAG